MTEFKSVHDNKEIKAYRQWARAGMFGYVPGSGDRIPVTRRDSLKETPTAAEGIPI